jgi:plastocyanin
MVLITPLVGAAVFLSGLAAALPTNSYDSSNSNNGYDSSSNSNSNYDSSNSNSNYNSGSNSNYNSGSNSNYNGNSNNYNGNNYDSSSTSTDESTSTSTTSSYNNNYNNNYDSSSTTSSYDSYTTSYGSGSNYWGGSGYEDCVNQCIAEFGGSTGGGSYQATTTAGSYGPTGTGATHTVLVAPSKGVFRMLPFATNASVGDTIEFRWGADNHTVTKSSQLLPCNKSSADPVFASGEQNDGFIYHQVVNDTAPIFYYCGTPGHCEQGMFGIINPPTTAPGAPSSVGGMMQMMAANDSNLAAFAGYTSNLTSNNEAAKNWGGAIDLAGLPEWSHPYVMTNVLFSRGVFAMNPEVLQADNTADLSSAATTPLMLPVDMSGALNAATASQQDPSSGDAAAQTPAAAAASDPAPSAQPSTKSSGASSVASPRLLVAAAVVVATIFAL